MKVIYIFYFLLAISIISVILTVYDKIASKHYKRNRIPEAILLFVSAIGGSIAMLLTMLMIRHKTTRAKFMVSIPVMIAIQIIAAVFFYLK